MVAATGYAPISIKLDEEFGSGELGTQALLRAMLGASEQVSDLIFSPGRPPQIEIHGQLVPIQAKTLSLLTADDTRRIAADLIGSNKQAISMLREQGSCDVSYGLPGVARFRVNAFIQRGSCAVVMRVIPTVIPSFSALGIPEHLNQIAALRDGIVLVTGPRGCGKSSTLASILDSINQQQMCHVITIEDPIEFLHNHKRATVHQRELHSDAPSYAQALRAALRQAPKVILVGDMHELETMEMVLEAAETGHLVLSSLNTVDAAKTLPRILASFPSRDQGSVRIRLAKTLRYIISQRLLPRSDGRGSVAAFEVLRVIPRVATAIETDDQLDRSLSQFMKEGEREGMQFFDKEIAKLVRAGLVDADEATTHASDPEHLCELLGR